MDKEQVVGVARPLFNSEVIDVYELLHLALFFFCLCQVIKRGLGTTEHPWCGDHFTNINAYRGMGAWAGVQVPWKEIHTYIHLDYIRVKILSWNFFLKKKEGGLGKCGKIGKLGQSGQLGLALKVGHLKWVMNKSGRLGCSRH